MPFMPGIIGQQKIINQRIGDSERRKLNFKNQRNWVKKGGRAIKNDRRISEPIKLNIRNQRNWVEKGGRAIKIDRRISDRG